MGKSWKLYQVYIAVCDPLIYFAVTPEQKIRGIGVTTTGRGGQQLKPKKNSNLSRPSKNNYLLLSWLILGRFLIIFIHQVVRSKSQQGQSHQLQIWDVLNHPHYFQVLGGDRSCLRSPHISILTVNLLYNELLPKLYNLRTNPKQCLLR